MPVHLWPDRGGCRCALALLLLTGFIRVEAGVFSGPPAAYESPPPARADSNPAVIRWIWVEERMTAARHQAPVRVPVFFSAGECRRPEELALVRWPDLTPVAVQTDDVRLGSDGGVARLHLWFVTDLTPGERQRWALVRRTRPPPVRADVAVRSHAGRLTVEAAGTHAEFFTVPTDEGALAALRLERGPDLVFPAGAGLRVVLDGEAGAEERPGELTWGTGPVFAKVIVPIGLGAAGRAGQVYRIFADGSLNLIQTIHPPDGMSPPAVVTQDFLQGRLGPGALPVVRAQSAAIVESLQDVHPGLVIDGLGVDTGSRGWLVVPGTLGGGVGRATMDAARQFRLAAPGGLEVAGLGGRSGTVRAYWAEVTLYPSDREGARLARAAVLRAAQPLVAVVERPGVGLAMALAGMEANVREMEPVGWVNQTVLRRLRGLPAPFPRRHWAAEADPAAWVAAARHTAAKTAPGGRPLAEHEKGRAAGPLDPYHLTYDTTPLVAWLMEDALPEQARRSLRARLTAVRTELGRTDAQGWPYLEVFNRTQNMQMGPPLLALADAGADPQSHRFYRDLLAAPALAAVQVRGFRPYEGSPQATDRTSDTVYQAVVDFMLRATELVLNESLGLHPVAFGRYLDAVDVNADLYHAVGSRPAAEGTHFARANFFRTQSHLHRWLEWGPSPWLALLRAPAAEGMMPGVTEAWHRAEASRGQWKNWPEQSWLYLATILPAVAAVHEPPVRPATAVVQVNTGPDGNRVTWEEVAEVVGYRIYRFRPGLAPVWLNSPYAGTGESAGMGWHDRAGQPGDRYRVHGVDAAERTSAW